MKQGKAHSMAFDIPIVGNWLGQENPQSENGFTKKVWFYDAITSDECCTE